MQDLSEPARTDGTDAALAAIVRSARNAIVGTTLEGIVTSWNDGATALYGYTSAEMDGRQFGELMPPDRLAEELARRASVASGDGQNGYRSGCRCKDGRLVDVVMSLSTVLDDAGRVAGLSSISRSVNEQEAADSRLASIMEAAPDGMLGVDSDGQITMANAQVTSLLGYSRTELLGAPLEMLLPEVLERHRKHFADFVSDPGPSQIGSGLAMSAQRADGTSVPVEISLSRSRLDDQTIFIAAIRDVTTQRELEAGLRVSEARFRQLAEHVDTVFVLQQLDPYLNLYVSPAFERLTGRSPDLAASPDFILDVAHAGDLEIGRTFMGRSRGGEQCNTELRIVRADREIRWVRLFAAPVLNERGAPERSVISMEDITERVQSNLDLRAAEAAARAANEAKSIFLSRMSHELRTPLNAVLGFGQLLERRLEGTNQVTPVRHILKAGRHLLDLINDVLDISRIEAGGASVSLEPIDLAAIVEETALLVEPMAVQRDITIWVNGGSELTYVLADRQRMRQVLLNLLSNAIKYNEPQGSVWISWVKRGDQVAVTVRDDGRGIAPELHDRLFTPFDRLGVETTGVEGTGVGLAVTRALVDLMHGAIAIESKAGAGASFIVTLPSTQEPFAQLAVPPTPDRTNPDSDGSTVPAATLLYIEDNEPNVRVIEAVLELRPAWRLLHAGLGRLGYELALAHQPDLILLDLHLPDGFGLDVLKRLKADPTTGHLPVVVLTADASLHQQDRLLAAGADQYLTKPLDVDALLAVLDTIAARLAAD